MEADRAEEERSKDAADRLTYEIFSILESKFLFGGYDDPKLLPSGGGTGGSPWAVPAADKVCVLSIDGGARAVDGLLAAASLVRLEAALRRRAGNQAARLADFFDVAAGSGAGGVLAAMLFARGPRGRPMYSAEDALGFLLRRVRKGWPARASGLLRRSASTIHKVFGELTLRDTVRPVLVPCYDLRTRAPFLFARADAVEAPAYDFRLRDVCAATCAGAAVEVRSVDGGTRIAAVGSGVALGNPTAAAITHVLNNRREFPAAAGINNLLVMSIGTGEADRKVNGNGGGRARPPEIARMIAEGVSDVVDQAVAMAFGNNRTSNYIRIQGTWARRRADRAVPRLACGGETKQRAVWEVEEILLQKNAESVLFQGRKLAGETNAEKLEQFARELVKEHGRRKQLTSSWATSKQPQQTTPQDASPARRTPSATAVTTQTAATHEAPVAPVRTAAVSRSPATSSYPNNLVSQMLDSIR